MKTATAEQINAAHFYRDGSIIVAVLTGQPSVAVQFGTGATPREAFYDLHGTPIQSTGPDMGKSSALRWAANNGSVTSAQLEAIKVTADDLEDRASAWDDSVSQAELDAEDAEDDAADRALFGSYDDDSGDEY